MIRVNRLQAGSKVFELLSDWDARLDCDVEKLLAALLMVRQCLPLLLAREFEVLPAIWNWRRFCTPKTNCITELVQVNTMEPVWHNPFKKAFVECLTALPLW
jgi:hypothetical protein